MRKNPFGQVPVLEDGERVIADSNASLTYLALEYDASGRWFPTDPVTHAEVVRWFAVASGPLVQGPAAARAHAVFGVPLDLQRAQTTAQNLFGVLESTLGARPFLTGQQPTVADLAVYTYTAHATEGGISLSPYANIRAWLERVRSIPGFIPIESVAHGELPGVAIVVPTRGAPRSARTRRFLAVAFIPGLTAPGGAEPENSHPLA